jgi:hypothetical protein
MSRLLKIPSYRLHKQSGQAVVPLTDSLGKRRDVLLGKYGPAESRVNKTLPRPQAFSWRTPLVAF